MSEEVIERGRVVNGNISNEVQVVQNRLWFSPSRIIGFALGVFLLVVGAMAVLRTGLDGTLNVPVTDVLGVAQTASTGLMELAAGLLLLAGCAAEDMRGLIGFVGGIGLVVGVLGLASSNEIRADIGFTSDTAWFFIVWGVVALCASFIPSILRIRRTVEREP